MSSQRKLPILSWRDVVKALSKVGFQPVRQRGSHIVLESGDRSLTVPRHDEIRRGILLERTYAVELRKLTKCQVRRYSLRFLSEYPTGDEVLIHRKSTTRPTLTKLQQVIQPTSRNHTSVLFSIWCYKAIIFGSYHQNSA